MPSNCSQNLRDSRIHRKRSFFARFTRTISRKNSWQPSFCQKCEVVGHFSLLAPRMCHLIVPQNSRDSRIHRKDRFWKGFQKQFKQRVCKHNLDFWAFFGAIVQNVPSNCSLQFAGLQDSQKMVFFLRMASHQNHPNSTKRFWTKVWFSTVCVSFSLRWPRMCYLIVPKSEGCANGCQDQEPRIQTTIAFFEGFSRET